MSDTPTATFVIYPHTISTCCSRASSYAWQVPPEVFDGLHPGSPVFYTYVSQDGVGVGSVVKIEDLWVTLRVDRESFDPHAQPDERTMSPAGQRPLFLIDFNDVDPDDQVWSTYRTISAAQRRVLAAGDVVWFSDVEGGLGTAVILELRDTSVTLELDMDTFSWDSPLPAPYDSPVYSRV